MPIMKLAWVAQSKAGFEQLRKRASDTGNLDLFIQVHNEIVRTLRDSEQAFEQGESLFKTQKAGGEVRLWVHKFISICYAVFREQSAGWILKYHAIPEDWPQ